MIVDIEFFDNKEELKISYIDRNRDRKFAKFNFKPYMWVEVPENARAFDPEYTSVGHKKVKKIASQRASARVIREEIFLNIKPNNPELFEPNIPKVHFFDIETDTTNKWPDAESATERVNTIAVVNENGDAFLLTLKTLTKAQLNNIKKKIDKHFEKFNTDCTLSYKKFENEYQLLEFFVTGILPKVTVLTGWNAVRYDWQYIYNRCARIGIDIRRASPTGGLSYGGPYDWRVPSHMIVIDYLDLFKKYDYSVKVKESDSLDWVSNAVLKLQKIKYNGSLTNLYDNEFEQYCFYNIVDTLLVLHIHQQLDCLTGHLMLSYLASTRIGEADSPVALTESLIQEDLYRLKKMVFAKLLKPPVREDYGGGWVKEPKPNMYQYVACFDFSSLYPTIKRMFNISPESYIGLFNPDTNIITNRDGETLEFDPAVHLKTAINTVYSREDSIVRNKLTLLYTLRKDTQKKSFQMSKIVHSAKNRLKQLV